MHEPSPEAARSYRWHKTCVRQEAIANSKAAAGHQQQHCVQHAGHCKEHNCSWPPATALRSTRRPPQATQLQVATCNSTAFNAHATTSNTTAGGHLQQHCVQRATQLQVATCNSTAFHAGCANSTAAAGHLENRKPTLIVTAARMHELSRWHQCQAACAPSVSGLRVPRVGWENGGVERRRWAAAGRRRCVAWASVCKRGAWRIFCEGHVASSFACFRLHQPPGGKKVLLATTSRSKDSHGRSQSYFVTAPL